MSKKISMEESEFTELLNTIQGLKTTISLLSKQVKTVEKNVNKKIKKIEKKANKKKANKKSKPSGFASPQHISEELRSFLGLEPDKKIARTEVTRYLINYINDNNLQNNANKQLINPDNTLVTLLKLNNEVDQLTYFNLQKYMNQHFIS